MRYAEDVEGDANGESGRELTRLRRSEMEPRRGIECLMVNLSLTIDGAGDDVFVVLSGGAAFFRFS